MGCGGCEGSTFFTCMPRPGSSSSHACLDPSPGVTFLYGKGTFGVVCFSSFSFLEGDLILSTGVAIDTRGQRKDNPSLTQSSQLCLILGHIFLFAELGLILCILYSTPINVP